MALLKKYVLSLQASHDLEDIFDYTRNKFGVDQAIQYVSEFEILFETLLANPDIGKNRDEIKPGLKSFPKTSHIVFYRVLPDHVRIVRVLHGSRDIIRFFTEGFDT